MTGGAAPTGYFPEVRADVRAMARQIAMERGPSVAAVLFYGSGLRRDDPEAILDLYVLVDSYRRVHRGLGAAFANRILPPNVLFLPSNAKTNAGFKVAVISRTGFAARMSPFGWDTSLWARFCQPSQLAYSRDAAARAWVDDALSAAAAAAMHWAVRLGPQTGGSRAYWTALFRRTYDAELRVEGSGRADDIYDFAPGWFDATTLRTPELAEEAGEIPAEALPSAAVFRRRIDVSEIVAASDRWKWRRRAGKLLNILRLIKALFTFENGVDYIVWKLERHSGQRVALTPWQRRHPLLAAPFVLTQLIRRGVVR